MVTPRGRIIVAGTDSSATEKACAFFERHGYSCVNAVNPEQVSALLEDDAVDVVVAIGSGARMILEKTPPMLQGNGWTDALVIAEDGTAGKDAREVESSDSAQAQVTPGTFNEDEQLLSRVAERVAVRRLARRLSDTHRLLQAWKGDIEELVGLSALGPFAGKAPAGPFGMLRAMVSLHDQVKDISSSLDEQTPFSGRCREHQCAVYVELLQAIRHTIEILRKTKQSFKSKELGELRSYLEALMTEHS